jgi:hypothetical protein
MVPEFVRRVVTTYLSKDGAHEHDPARARVDEYVVPVAENAALGIPFEVTAKSRVLPVRPRNDRWVQTGCLQQARDIDPLRSFS